MKEKTSHLLKSTNGASGTSLPENNDLPLTAKDLEDYVENAAIGMHWIDKNGMIKWANKAELTMLGYSKEEYIGHHISEFHAEPENISEILERLSRNETLNAFESVLLCKDGTTKTVQISSSVYWENGKFAHTRCFTIDVTEQKKLIQALRGSEMRYKQLVDNIKVPLYTTDESGQINLYNQAAVDLWGREPEVGKDLWCGSQSIKNPDGSELPSDACPMARTIREARPVIGEEIVIVRPDGDVRHVSPYPQPLFDESGKLIGAVNVLLDISEMKSSETALRESEGKLRDLTALLEKKVEERTKDLVTKNEELKRSEERYHKMIEEVYDYAIILLDKDGTILNWNKGAQNIKGYTDKEIVGKSFRLFYLPEDRERGLAEKLINQAVVTGKANHEGWRMRKDGSRFWGNIVITALHDENNNIIGFSKVTRDLTEKKLAEDKLKEYTTVLEFQNKELEQFAYAASHDMKEPLRKIHFYNSFIFENAYDNLDERSKEYLTRSMNAVKRMSDLIEDLLAYSKTTSNLENFEQVDLNEIVEEIALLHKEEFEQKQVRIKMDELPVIHAIAFQVKQLMANLINNSIKYKHPDRNCNIRITYEPIQGKQITDWNAEPQKKYYKIAVIDNGIGFESENSEKVFEIFQRLSNVGGAKGSGIGLAICKKIVQNHKGFIRAYGTVNEGATFEVYFPEN